MSFSGLGTTSLTVLVDNTSPILLDGVLVDDLTTLADNNAPAITGFGFNATDPIPTIASWELKDKDGTVIGNSSGAGVWKMESTLAGISMDFLPTSGNGKGGLYNPAAVGPFGGPPLFLTTARLAIEFNSAFNLDTVSLDRKDPNPFMRFQNVGAGGEGSLKLATVPEPATLFLLGLGLGVAGLAGSRRRRRNR